MKTLFICFTILCLSLVNIRVFAESGNPQMVTFKTADGGRINALLYRNGDHAVVLGHGAVFNKESWSTFAEELSAKGFTVLAIDFRGYGKSEPGTNRNALYEDILGAVRYLREQGASKVSVVGASMGGNAAAKASVAVKTDEIDKLVLLSPAGIDQPGRLQGDKLFIASKNESMASDIKAMFEKAPDPKRILLLEGEAHAQHIFKTSQAKQLTTAIVDFLKD